MWTIQVDDTIGGWIVTDHPHPLSEHNNRLDGNPTKRGEIIAECHSQGDAELIARLLNEYETTMQRRSLKRLLAPECCRSCGAPVEQRDGAVIRDAVAVEDDNDRYRWGSRGTK
jgi:hypothetical protein